MTLPLYPYEGQQLRLYQICATVPCMSRQVVSELLKSGVTTKAGLLSHDLSAAKRIGGLAAKRKLIETGKYTYRNQRV